MSLLILPLLAAADTSLLGILILLFDAEVLTFSLLVRLVATPVLDLVVLGLYSILRPLYSLPLE